MLLNTSGAVVNHAIEAHNSLTQGEMHFQVKSKVKKKISVVSGTVDYKKGQALTVSIEDQSPGRVSSRVFHVEGSQFSAYDRYSDEAIRRPVPSSRTLSGRLLYVLGNLPDPVMAASDPTWVKGFLKGLSKTYKLTASDGKSGSSLSIRWPRSTDGTLVKFNKKGLLTSFGSTRGADTFQWSISYSGTYHGYDVPSGAASVTSFHKHAPPPHFANAQARAVSLSVLRAARQMKPAKIVVKRPGHQTAIFWDKGKIRQNNGSSFWAYDGSILTVSVGKSFYRGKASHADVLDYLAALTNGEDSLARTFLLRSNPLDDFFQSNATVRVAGTVKLPGASSTILKISGPASDSSIIVRDANHLVESTETSTLGNGGQVAFRDEVSYVYQPLPSGSASLFNPSIPSHAKVKKLPKSAIKFTASYADKEIEYVPKRKH